MATNFSHPDLKHGNNIPNTQIIHYSCSAALRLRISFYIAQGQILSQVSKVSKSSKTSNGSVKALPYHGH